MATEIEHQGDVDGDVEIVLDDGGGASLAVVSGPEGDQIGRDDPGDDEPTSGGGTVVDAPARGSVVEVVVVPDAYASADHANAPQVFASAVRLRPIFTVMSVVLMVLIALAVYGVSVLAAA